MTSPTRMTTTDQLQQLREAYALIQHLEAYIDELEDLVELKPLTFVLVDNTFTAGAN